MKFALTNQKHDPDLGSDASPDVICGENSEGVAKMSAVFSGYLFPRNQVSYYSVTYYPECLSLLCYNSSTESTFRGFLCCILNINAYYIVTETTTTTAELNCGFENSRLQLAP